jgi:hypothetical protein
MPDDRDLEVTVQSSRGQKNFTFPKQSKVSEVISTAASAFGFTLTDTFRLVLATSPGNALEAMRTLVSYHIADGTVLILTDLGSGV